MDATLFNGFWISTDTYLTQEHRNENAKIIYEYFKNLGWTKNAISAILGNMDVESSVNPALIEGRTYPNIISNSTCLTISNRGVGLVQWTGNTDTPPVGQKLASFAIRHNMLWYDGNLQCFRLETEWQNDLQFDHGRVDGVEWEWDNFVTSTESPEQLAKVWQYLYERGGTDTELRQQKANYYFRLLGALPPWMIVILTRKRKELKPQCLRI